MKKFWLSEENLEKIISILKNFWIEKAKIFWSRAMWNYKNWSDIDIAIFWKIDFDKFLKISQELRENFIYDFDVIIYDDIWNIELKKHIDLEWIDIFS